MNRVGIYSGTFDPVHAGHVAFAQEAMKVCKLDEVIFLPERAPRGKQNVTSIPHRQALLRHAIGAAPGMRVVILDTEQFTVQQTLPQLQQICKDAELVMLIGSDVAKSLVYGWPDIQMLLTQVSFAIGLREGDADVEVVDAMRQVEASSGVPVVYKVIRTPHAGAKSSIVRRSGSSSALHPKVGEYIQRHGLYK